ncbi:MAG: flavin reductase family protein [Clostridia bacterium]|nr:flavin reductase family protein [Clostridia bacterium]
MRKNLGSKPYIFPQPVLIIGTYDENGKANAMNAAWGGIVGMHELIVDLGSHKTTDNIAVKKAFTVSIADVAHTVACDYVGIASGRKVADKMEKAGFTTVKSDFVDAPIINELPLALECELTEVLSDGKYLGKIVNVSADESILGDDGDVSLEKFFPIIFDTAHSGYYRLGEQVGQAFSDGKKLM